MVDIHCHIIPGVDDGAQNDAEALEMLKNASLNGITSVVATPHHMSGDFRNEPERVLAEVARLDALASAEGIGVRVLPGQEVRVYSGMGRDYESGSLIGIAGSAYVLIEFSFALLAGSVDYIIADLMSAGAKPVLAHPERYPYFKDDPSKLFELVDDGVLMQVTAGSIAGVFGRRAQELCFRMIEQGAVHVVASDAHNSGGRSFNMSEAYALIEGRYGIGYADWLKGNAQKIIDGKLITPFEGVISARRLPKRKIGLFGIFCKKQ